MNIKHRLLKALLLLPCVVWSIGAMAQDVAVQEGLCPDGNHPHLIDLGLPSGTKWACCNVGASMPQDYGDYYAWGETAVKDYYHWDSYEFGNANLGQCQSIGSNISGTDLDAARATWGGRWQMPTLAQVQELLNNCTFEECQMGGVNGGKFTAPNGKSIFLPDGGVFWDVIVGKDTYGRYWSGTVNPDNDQNAYFLEFEGDVPKYGNSSRCSGRSVRPVFDDEAIVVSSFSLGTKVLTMDVGETIGLTYTIENKENTPLITWTSSNESVAVVNVEGNITAVSKGFCTVTASYGEDIQEECAVVVGNTTGTSDGHDYVDLGLPSGTLWATTNLGSDSPEDEGISYQWGASSEGGESDGLEELSSDEDEADNLWGAYWRTPSRAQMEELVNTNFTTITQTSMNGVDGFLISSLVNGKVIFLPASSSQNDDAPLTGHYWSRTPSDNASQVYELFLSSANSASCISIDRGNELAIRPVYEGIKTNSSIIVSSGDLNFGTVAVGSSRSLSFDVWNNTYEPQAILPFSLDNTDFSIDWNGGELQPNATQTVTVTYSPTSTVIATGGSFSIGTSAESSLVNVYASSHKGSRDLTTKSDLVVWGKDGSQTIFVLNDRPIVTIADGIIKIEATTASAEFSFSDILKLTYEGLIEQPTSLNDIDMKKTFDKTADALTFYSDREDLHVKIVTLSGIVVHQSTVNQGSNLSLPLNQFSTGVYIINVNKITYKIAIR